LPRAMDNSVGLPLSPPSLSWTRAIALARSITSALPRTPPGGRSTALAWVFCTVSPLLTSCGHRLRETPRRTPSGDSRGRWPGAALSRSRTTLTIEEQAHGQTCLLTSRLSHPLAVGSRGSRRTHLRGRVLREHPEPRRVQAGAEAQLAHPFGVST